MVPGKGGYGEEEAETGAETGAELEVEPEGPLAALSLEVSRESLRHRFDDGRAWLESKIGEENLAVFYGSCLSRRRGFSLETPEPLPPSALAALLLPLPREVADRLSVAGWYPSKRRQDVETRELWSVIFTPPGRSWGKVELSPEAREAGAAAGPGSLFRVS